MRAATSSVGIDDIQLVLDAPVGCGEFQCVRRTGEKYARFCQRYDIGLGGDVFNPEVHRVVHHKGSLQPAQGAATRRVLCPFQCPRLGRSVVAVVEDVGMGILRKQA